jgi:hypothetical protein
MNLHIFAIVFVVVAIVIACRQAVVRDGGAYMAGSAWTAAILLMFGVV